MSVGLNPYQNTPGIAINSPTPRVPISAVSQFERLNNPSQANVLGVPQGAAPSAPTFNNASSTYGSTLGPLAGVGGNQFTAGWGLGGVPVQNEALSKMLGIYGTEQNSSNPLLNQFMEMLLPWMMSLLGMRGQLGQGSPFDTAGFSVPQRQGNSGSASASNGAGGAVSSPEVVTLNSTESQQGNTNSGIGNIFDQVKTVGTNLLNEAISSGKTLAKKGKEVIKAATEADKSYFTFPLQQSANIRATSPAGFRGNGIHRGNDYAAPLGHPVLAAADGEVIGSFEERDELGVFKGYGRYIKIKHDNGKETLYAHLKSSNVKKGDKVTQGAVIGALGSTGNSTGPHLHFEIREQENGQMVYRGTKHFDVAFAKGANGGSEEHVHSHDGHSHNTTETKSCGTNCSCSSCKPVNTSKAKSCGANCSCSSCSTSSPKNGSIAKNSKASATSSSGIGGAEPTKVAKKKTDDKPTNTTKTKKKASKVKPKKTPPSKSKSSGSKAGKSK